MMTRWRSILLIIGILLIALNLRPAITAIGPLAERMTQDGLSRTLIGSMTTVPLVLFGLVGLVAGAMGNRFGMARAMALGLIILACGCGLRYFEDNKLSLIASTVLIGAGIALGNVLLPGLVKRRFPRHVGLLTSLYSTGINLGAAAGVAVAVPLADRLPGGWSHSLAFWGIVALITFLLWTPQWWAKPIQMSRSDTWRGMRRLLLQPRAWQIALYMGIQSSIFYSVVAWLPTVMQHRGLSEGAAAGWVTGMQVLGCAASLILPILAGRSASQSVWIAASTLLTTLSLVSVLVLPVSGIGWAVLVLGAGVNSSFSLTLLILALRSRDAETAAALSSMAQAVGYLVAAPGPWLVGTLSATSGGWPLAFGLLITLGLIGAVLGALSGRTGVLSLEEAPEQAR